LVMVTK